MNKTMIFLVGILIGCSVMTVRAVTYEISEDDRTCSGTPKVQVTKDTIRTFTCSVVLKEKK